MKPISLPCTPVHLFHCTISDRLGAWAPRICTPALAPTQHPHLLTAPCFDEQDMGGFSSRSVGPPSAKAHGKHRQFAKAAQSNSREGEHLRSSHAGSQPVRQKSDNSIVVGNVADSIPAGILRQVQNPPHALVFVVDLFSWLVHHNP